MATQKGVWDLQDVRDKQLQSEWGYRNAGSLYISGNDPWESGTTGLSNRTTISSPTQIPGDWALNDNILASGNKHMGMETGVFAIKNDGTLWGWGAAGHGQLGQNDRVAHSSPVQVGSETTWKTLSIAGVNARSVGGIKTDGTLWTWGDNSNFTLGQSTSAPADVSSPVQVPGTTWKSVLMDGKAFMGLKTDGTLWVCGANQDGALGHNDKTQYSSPKQIPGTTWGDSFGGWDNVHAAVKTDGTLWSWGTNGNGELGLNDRNEYSSPKQVPGTTWRKICQGFGDSASLGLKTDGTLWAWGLNETGVLGLNQAHEAKVSSPTQVPGTTWDNVSHSFNHVMATKTDGTLWTWGNGGSGQLGKNNRTSYSSPVQVPGTWEKTIDAGGYTFVALKN